MLFYGTQTPAKIGNLPIDVVVSHEAQLNSEVTEYPVEDGFAVADHVVRSPIKLTMTAVFTPTPVSYLGSLGNNANRLTEVLSELQAIYHKGEPVMVTLADSIYPDMVMTSAPLPRTVEDGFCYKTQLEFTQIRRAMRKTEDIPEEKAGEEAKGKAGATEEDRGAASIQEVGTGIIAAPNAVTVPGGVLETSQVDMVRNGGINTGMELRVSAAVSVLSSAFGSVSSRIGGLFS